MKRIIVFIMALSIYCSSKGDDAIITIDLQTFLENTYQESLGYDNDDPSKFAYIDSCIAITRSQVFGIAKARMDTNSLEYADFLFEWMHWINYFSQFNREIHTLALKTKKIALSKEGKGPHYSAALSWEIESWNVDFTIPMRSYSSDTLAIVHQLLEEELACLRKEVRPVDSIGFYADELTKLFMLDYHRPDSICDEPQVDEDVYSSPCVYDELHRAAYMWNDLLKWPDLTEAEYREIYSGKAKGYMFRGNSFYAPLLTIDKKGQDNEYNYETFSHYQRYSPPSYFQICHADKEIVQRVAGTQSTWFKEAAARYLDALIGECYGYKKTQGDQADSVMLITRQLCAEVLSKASLSYKEEFLWRSMEIKCIMSISTLKNETQELMNQLQGNHPIKCIL